MDLEVKGIAGAKWPKIWGTGKCYAKPCYLKTYCARLTEIFGKFEILSLYRLINITGDVLLASGAVAYLVSTISQAVCYRHINIMHQFFVTGGTKNNKRYVKQHCAKPRFVKQHYAKQDSTVRNRAMPKIWETTYVFGQYTNLSLQTIAVKALIFKFVQCTAH